MKKIIFTFLIFTGIIGFINAQSIVTTNKQHRNVVMEEFTGLNCVYCPQGHTISQGISDNNPNRVVLINIHQGSFATPSTGQPDYRTSFGDAIAGQTGLTGYPSGTVNRHKFPGYTTTAMGRGEWEATAAQIFPLPSYVNVGFTSTFDTVSRLLTVNVELYYTGNSPVSSNKLNVALLQSNIIGYQSGGSTSGGATNSYNHKHMLRHLLTGQWGEVISTTTQGTLVQKTYTYTVPASYNNIACKLADCDIAVFVTETNQEVVTGVQAPAINGSNDGTTSLYIADLTATNDFQAGTATNASTFDLSFVSLLAGSENFTVTMTADQPGDWSSVLKINGNAQTSPATVSFDYNQNNTITVEATPGTTPYLGKYNITVSSVSNPSATPKTYDVYLISGVTDLVVKGSGSWGNGGSYDFQQQYLDALAAAGNTTYASTGAMTFEKGFNANALTGVNNVYLNIAWTFPTMTDEEATALMSFMDNGGNVFIAGQDIGWDIMSGDGYGSTVTQNFYTNYLKAGYAADGSSTNNQLTAIAGESIFGTTASSSITDPYSNNMYPDQLNALTGATPIFYYNSTSTKKAGIRFNNSTYKVVYLGIGIEMISNLTVKNQIIKTAHDWFYGIVSDEEMVFTENKLNVYPNPAINNINIESPSKFKSIELIDITGKVVKSINSETTLVNINLSDVSNGIYTLRISENDNISYRKIEVIK